MMVMIMLMMMTILSQAMHGIPHEPSLKRSFSEAIVFFGRFLQGDDFCRLPLHG